MEKADVSVRQVLTLVGPNTVIRVLDDQIKLADKLSDAEMIEKQTVYFGVAAKAMKDYEGIDGLIKHISPIDEFDNYRRHVMRIYVY